MGWQTSSPGQRGGYPVHEQYTHAEMVQRWRRLPVSRQQAIIDAVGDLAIGSRSNLPDAIVAEHCLALLAEPDLNRVQSVLRELEGQP